MGLADQLEEIASVAAEYADEGEQLAGVIAAEPQPGHRTYLVAYARAEARSWLAFDAAGAPVATRGRVREAVSIAAMCEVADESAGGGDLADLRAQLVALRLTEHPPGIEEAEEAALALEGTVGAPPRLATPEYLETLGAATRRLEEALGDASSGSPFAQAMRHAVAVVEALANEVESTYKRPLA